MNDGVAGPRTMLLDTASLYYRAFYGVPVSVIAPDGTPVNAVRGLLDIVAKLITTYRPTDLVACWDEDWRPAWRVALVPSYKLHRVASDNDGAAVEDAPDELTVQVPIIREVLDAIGIAIAGAPGFEADDVIGTLAAGAGAPVDIVTGDRDLFQLVDDGRGVRVVYTARGMSDLQVVTDGDILARYGVHAAQYADFALLRGDASDGLPGVPGVGEKTAASLLGTHGTVHGVLAAARQGTGMTARVSAKILDAADYLRAAGEVVRVACDVPLAATDTRLRAPGDAARGRAAHLADRWGLHASMTRVFGALDGR